MEPVPEHKRKIAAAVLILAVLAAFGATLTMGFLWDDHQIIEANPYIKSWTWSNIRHAFASDPFNQSLNYYRPFQTLSHMLDFSLWGLGPFGYRLTNLALHAAGTLLVFALLGELGLGAAAAFLSALFFAVNPVVIEQFLVVAGRAELASTAFTLASILAFLKRRHFLSFIFFLLSLGFKENGVITPLLIALSLWFLRKEKREYLKLSLFLLPIPFYLWLRHSATGMGVLSGNTTDILLALKKLPVVILIYIKNAFLPLNMHSHRMQPGFSAWSYASYAVWVPLLAVLVKRGGRIPLFITGWYLINLAPKLPILLTNDLMLEHWTHLSNLGLYMAAAVAAAFLIERGGAGRIAAGAAAGFIAIFWVSLANANIRLRNTDMKIYEHSALYSSSKPMLYNLSREYYFARQFGKSRDILTKISGLDPGNVLYRNGLALSLRQTGYKKEGLAVLDGILNEHPDNAEALQNKAHLLLELNRSAEAVELFRRSIKTAPGGEPAYTALAGIYLRQGKETEAMSVYDELLRLNPHNLEALNNSGIISAKNGRYAEAEALFKRVLKTDPEAKSALANLERLNALKTPGPR